MSSLIRRRCRQRRRHPKVIVVVEVIIHNIVRDDDNGRGTSTRRRRRPRKSSRCRHKRGCHVDDDSLAMSGLSSRRLRPKVVVVVDVIIHDVIVATMNVDAMTTSTTL